MPAAKESCMGGVKAKLIWKWRALVALGSLSPAVHTLRFAVPERLELFGRIWFCSEYGIVKIPFEVS